MYLMMAVKGRNMQYMQTHGVFIPELCRMDYNKHYLTIWRYSNIFLITFNVDHLEFLKKLLLLSPA
jgi:hypothetical protein